MYIYNIKYDLMLIFYVQAGLYEGIFIMSLVGFFRYVCDNYIGLCLTLCINAVFSFVSGISKIACYNFSDY